ncbi:hypothetical protein [Alteraurantiacibacter aquimixticola]|uniref:DUF4410 domain-containing protein n=1 Tax=Alteraurantiacibacter aquimixticola TaxID=2489173 RepID=A0A4T3F7H8_9SPHN|nr:hypothetical protein [Alteraurantiacibacter aquimixticola]TIX51662.1 hypothetical protein E5222_04215 [Alteraurantiacibacter aquimixticola]
MRQLILLPFLALAASCASLPSASTVGAIANSLTSPSDQPEMAPIDLRRLQTREYRDAKPAVFAATMAVLMDVGYRIQSADIGSGLIIASATSVEKVKLDLRGLVATRQTPIASVFVEQTGDGSRLRVNLTISDAPTGTAGPGERAIRDEGVYATFFGQLESELRTRRVAEAVEPAEPQVPHEGPSASDANEADMIADHALTSWENTRDPPVLPLTMVGEPLSEETETSPNRYRQLFPN